MGIVLDMTKRRRRQISEQTTAQPPIRNESELQQLVNDKLCELWDLAHRSQRVLLLEGIIEWGVLGLRHEGSVAQAWAKTSSLATWLADRLVEDSTQ